MKYTARSLRSFQEFEVEGEAIVTSDPITLLGFVDPTSGKIVEESHELNGQSITGKVFVFPRGVGSTVGPYTLINLVKNGMGPLAIINRESDQGTVAGCSVARIPMVYGMNEDPTVVIKTGDHVKITASKNSATLEVNE
ncbi:MAG: aconitase X swivel domain-containing protein [Candidatus Kariarchaeaceae archaeon]